jgi:hypothetical protein
MAACYELSHSQFVQYKAVRLYIRVFSCDMFHFMTILSYHNISSSNLKCISFLIYLLDRCISKE